MYHKSKYVIVKFDGHLLPVVFSDLTGHSFIVESLLETFDPKIIQERCVGAGFCHIDHDTRLYVCYDKSASLKIKSRGEEDAKILNKYLGLTTD